MSDHRITITDLLESGKLDRAMIDRAAVEQSLGSVRIAMHLCTEGALSKAARSDGGLAARIVLRRMEARRLDRELRRIEPSSEEAPALHRRASCLINEVGIDLVNHHLLGMAVESPTMIALLKEMEEYESSNVSSIMRENGVKKWMFSMTHYGEVIGE